MGHFGHFPGVAKVVRCHKVKSGMFLRKRKGTFASCQVKVAKVSWKPIRLGLTSEPLYTIVTFVIFWGEGKSMPPVAGKTVRVRSFTDRVAQPVDWLWQGRLALGKLALLDGDPGLGKSLVALDLCARLSRGLTWPDGSASLGPGASLILNAEDGEEDTTALRLEGLGAEASRVFTFGKDDPRSGNSLSLPTQTDLLEEAVTQSCARLVVLDPLMAFLGRGVITSSDQGVRQALQPLRLLAERQKCVVLMIRHLNKSGRDRALYRGGGSIGFIGACRSGWLVGQDPQDAGRRILAQVKNNLGPPQPSLTFAIEPADPERPMVKWLGPSTLTADDLLGRRVGGSSTWRPRDRACEFLTAALAEGPRTSRDLWELARKEGLSERTLNRAKQELGIRSVWLGALGRPLSYWLLPGQELPAEVSAEVSLPDLEPWLAPLREKYPPPTPLDDW
jgi:hypothetical protein